MEDRRIYKDLLLWIKPRLTSPGMINDSPSVIYDVLLSRADKAIKTIVEKGKSNLLTDEYLYYLASYESRRISDYLKNIVHHLEDLTRENKQTAILEVHEFCKHQYLAKYDIRFLISNYDGDTPDRDFNDAIDKIYVFINKLTYYYNSCSTKVKLLKEALLYALAYSLYENGGVKTFNDYYDYITGDYLKFIDKFALSGIFDAETGFYEGKEYEIFNYLKKYLDDFSQDYSKCPEIK